MSNKLLPCPFCGGEAKIDPISAYEIYCTKCGAASGVKKKAREATKAWNTRSPAMYEALEKSTRYLIGERDALDDGCTDRYGNYENDIDRRAVDEINKLINDNQQVLKAAGGR